MDKFTNIDNAAHSGANGHNHQRLPTPAQLDAGNYAKGRETLYGLRLVIETPRNTLRHWRAADGTSGSNLMKFNYGYIAGTLGNDGDELDVFIGPMPETRRVYVINQNTATGGVFDEHKIMLGFPDQRTAMAGYVSNYSAGWQGLGSCVACSIEQLKWWIANGNKSRPLTKDQLPYEGTDNTMEKVIWDHASPTPLRFTLDQVLYRLRAHDAGDGLLYDAVSMADVLGDADSVLTFDALVVPFVRIEQRMGIMKKVLDRAGSAIKVAAMQVSDPFTQRGTTNVAVIWELTDGQTVTVFFHNPDVTPKKIAPSDDLVSWKWMLNKKDITVAVAPEKGRDLEVRIVAARIMALAEKNSARFIKANGKRAERLETITGLQAELDAKKATLSDLEQQVEAAQVARDAAGLDEPEPITPDPLPAPDPQPEPAPAPALDVDSIKAVVTYSDPMAGVPHGASWTIMNAPRPLLGTETMSNGEFLSGRFYAAIDPADSMAAAYLAENVKLDASVVFVADAATQTAMALNTVNPKYLPAYMEMDADERASAVSGFITKLNGRTYGELKELAAKGMPAMPDAEKPGEPQKEVYRDHLIYSVNIKAGDGVASRFAVQTVENREREAAGERPIGGDSLHETIEAARAEVDRMIAKAEADAASNAEWEAKQAAEAEKAAAARAEFEDVDGFTDGMTAMQKEKALQALNAVVNYRGTTTTRKAIIRQKVADGFRIENDETDGRILTDGDVFQGVKQITKTGLDYAAYLIAKLPAPEVTNEQDEAAAKKAAEDQESADGDFLALASTGDVDFYDKAVTDRLAALAKKYTDPDGAYLDLVNQAKTAAKQFFVAEFKKKVG